MSITITIDNVCNVKHAELSLRKNYLNVKYGNNGTGKTSITKAIAAYAAGEDMEDLTPFGSDLTPSVTFSEPINDVYIFNDAYVEKNLFQKNDTLRNTFEIIVKTNDYTAREEAIRNKLNAVLSILDNSEFLLNFVSDIQDFGREAKIHAKTGLFQGKGKVGSGISRGYSIATIHNDNPLKKHLTSVDTAAKWSDWFEEGAEYVDDEGDCPYCGTAISEEIDSFQQEINSAMTASPMKKLMESLKYFEKLTKYLPEDERNLINSWIGSGEILNRGQVEHIMGDYRALAEEAVKISKLRDTKYKELVESVLDNTLLDNLRDSKLNTSGLFSLMDASLDALAEVDRFNDALDVVINATTNLSADLQELNNITRDNINRNSAYINDFLDIAGMPYRIVVEESDAGYKTILKPANTEDAPDNIADCLSYGEKNALSLLLFSLDAKSSSHDLIVLDDPISSFDNNKKYALLHQLFAYGVDNLRGKTVLMVTHDFAIVVDLIKQDLLKMVYYHCVEAKYLRNDGERVTETLVERNSFMLRTRYEKEKFSDASRPKICRLLHYRRYLELIGESFSDKYELVSSFLHGDLSPKDYHHQLIDDYMSIQEKINEEPGFGDFDYKPWINSLTDTQLKADYFNPSTTSLEKLEIIRFYVQKHYGSLELGAIMWKYITETYHIDNDTTSVLDDGQFDTIPAHLIQKCDEVMNRI
ncbi:MAG: hypothetical protein MJ220_02345 [Bacilli bacterium]|nr:hypothetical protein [Bacilli bacterium]